MEKQKIKREIAAIAHRMNCYRNVILDFGEAIKRNEANISDCTNKIKELNDQLEKLEEYPKFAIHGSTFLDGTILIVRIDEEGKNCFAIYEDGTFGYTSVLYFDCHIKDGVWRYITRQDAAHKLAYYNIDYVKLFIELGKEIQKLKKESL